MTTKGITGFRLGPNSTAAYGPIWGATATDAEFVQMNPILPTAFLGYESDTRKLKIGDGTSDWNTLPYWHDILPYGDCYGHEIAWVQASAAQNTWYEISHAGFTDGAFVEVSHDGNGKLTIGTAGKYLVSYSVAVQTSVANKHIETAISVNGTEQNNGAMHFTIPAANAAMPMAGQAILDLAAGDTVQVSVRTTDSGTPSIQVDHVNLTVLWIGG